MKQYDNFKKEALEEADKTFVVRLSENQINQLLEESGYDFDDYVVDRKRNELVSHLLQKMIDINLVGG